jgi:hypothetical protein
VTDLFTKYVEFFAMETQTAHETARKLGDYISRHSIMDTILTDQGKNFQSELISELWKVPDVHKSRTPPYFPSCNGNCERMMRTLQNMLSNYVNDEKNNWDEYLPILMFAYNTATHASHKFTPFALQHGRQARFPLELMHPSDKIELYLTPESYAGKLQDDLPTGYEHVAKTSKWLFYLTRFVTLPTGYEHVAKTSKWLFYLTRFVTTTPNTLKDA